MPREVVRSNAQDPFLRSSIAIRVDIEEPSSVRVLKILVPSNPEDEVFQAGGELEKKLAPTNKKEGFWWTRQMRYITPSNMRVLEETYLPAINPGLHRVL